MSPAELRVAWDAAWARYAAALAAENEFDGQHIHRFVPFHLPVGVERAAACDSIPASVWEESGRLGDIRCDAEDDLFVLPAPDFAAFARKVIICRADGRDLNGLDGRLVEEARRLLGEPG